MITDNSQVANLHIIKEHLLSMSFSFKVQIITVSLWHVCGIYTVHALFPPTWILYIPSLKQQTALESIKDNEVQLEGRRW